MKKNIPFLKGKKLDLCPIDENLHLSNVLLWMNDSDITKWLLMLLPASAAQEKDWFAKQSFLSNPPSDIVLAIVLKDGQHIGNIGLHKIDWISRRAELGIVIGDKDQWGKGYASEAEKLLIHYAFESLGLNKLYAPIFADNVGSQKAIQKNGAHEEARLKNHYWKNGKYNDSVIFSIFRDDFIKR